MVFSPLLLLALQVITVQASMALPRHVRVKDQTFVLASTNATLTMIGPNIVVKGPPYMPSVTGSSICNDTVNDECSLSGTCTSCTTFNEMDAQHILSMGWNAIRLGVVWAGAQPTDSDQLDPAFVQRLQAVLALCQKYNIQVVLDNHGDMVGTAGCGNGVPMWVQKKAAPELIGRPLETGFPYSLVPSLNIKKLAGYAYCGDNATKWQAHAGDPNYNLLNECCQQMNSPNPGNLGYTTINQKTMSYVMGDGQGRRDFVRFWTLMAEAVKNYPNAFAFELMNEPMSIRRREMYETWRAVAEAVNAVIPDLSVSVTDTGEGAILPKWLVELAHGAGADIAPDTVEWIKNSTTLFYSFHWYGAPKSADEAMQNALQVGKQWNLPTFLTEFGSCDAWRAARAVNISHSYWHYSSYCTTGPAFGNRSVPDDTFGACILGWAGGDSSKTCP